MTTSLFTTPEVVSGTVGTTGTTILVGALRLPVPFARVTERRCGSHDAHTLHVPIEIAS